MSHHSLLGSRACEGSVRHGLRGARLPEAEKAVLLRMRAERRHTRDEPGLEEGFAKLNGLGIRTSLVPSTMQAGCRYL